MATMSATRSAGARHRSVRLARVAGWVLTVGVGVFLAFDAVVHVSPAAVQSFHQLGFPVAAALPLSLIEACCVVLYLVPRTKILGAIFLTGYLGGAVALNVRMGAPLATVTLGPVYLAIVLWAAIGLRDARLRAVLSPWVRPRGE